MVSRHAFVGRRRGARRAAEAHDVYVDRYTPGEWALAGGIVLLSFLDLVLTLVYLALGGGEANPIMDRVLDHGRAAFVLVKMGVTVAGSLVLLVHVRFRRVRGVLVALLGLYLALLAVHWLAWIRHLS